ncbi:MAG: response regulator [Anaerolineales bacterium]|nr:response regulator [Anaerolineales bacterium]MCB9145468.1 response regulator [Anaerolineales bacterium]
MPRILFIDDEPINQQLVARALEPLNCELFFAENGTNGIAQARALLPDAIITDVMMPDITGYELTRILRRETQFSSTPILILTAQSGLQDKLQSFEAGADDHLTKPFEASELAARVMAMLRRVDAARMAAEAPIQEGGRMIAVHSLRGGTGCSSIAVNLGVGMVSLWRRPTVLLDLTMTAGQVALMLNMTLRRTWTDIVRYSPGELDFDMLTSIMASHESGLAFVAAPTFPSQAEPIQPELLYAAFNLFKSKFEYVIADLPHDFSDPAIQALDVADMILMVATPDMASIRAVSAAVDTYQKLGYPKEKIKLLLNATFPSAGLPREKIEAALGIPALTLMPYFKDVFVSAINYGKPVVTENQKEPAAAFLEDLTFFLSKDKHKTSRPENPTETWARVHKRYLERKNK